MTKFECPKCHVVFDSDFTDEFELHIEQEHQDYLAEHEDFNAYDHVLEEDSGNSSTPEQLSETSDKSEKVLNEVKKTLEEPLDKQVKDMKKQMVHDYLTGKAKNKALDDMIKHYLMEFLKDRYNIFHMKCARHPESTWNNKGDYIQHLRECQPKVLSRYNRIYESLSEELRLRLPEPTEPDYGALAKAWTEYAMTVENVTTISGSQEPEHRVIPEEEYTDATKEVQHCSEMLSAEAKKLGIEFQNVPIRDQMIVLAFLKERKKRKEELSKKPKSLGDMSLGYQPQ
jgi:hypothetical protein